MFENDDDDDDENDDGEDKNHNENHHNDKNHNDKNHHNDKNMHHHLPKDAPNIKRTDSGQGIPSDHKRLKHESGNVQDIRKQNWIRKDILVRIISKKVANGKFYKRKGIIYRVIDKYTAQVEILDSGPDQRDGGDVVEVDQKYLETVVPKEGKIVRIVNGQCRGMLARLICADHEKCRGTLELVEDGTILKRVNFDDFSKAVMDE
jgi:DNA/RNA-binding protein KIN17